MTKFENSTAGLGVLFSNVIIIRNLMFSDKESGSSFLLQRNHHESLTGHNLTPDQLEALN